MVQGRIGKFYSEICLVEQQFVKNPDIKINKLLEDEGNNYITTDTIEKIISTIFDEKLLKSFFDKLEKVMNINELIKIYISILPKISSKAISQKKIKFLIDNIYRKLSDEDWTEKEEKLKCNYNKIFIDELNENIQINNLLNSNNKQIYENEEFINWEKVIDEELYSVFTLFKFEYE